MPNVTVLKEPLVILPKPKKVKKVLQKPDNYAKLWMDETGKFHNWNDPANPALWEGEV